MMTQVLEFDQRAELARLAAYVSGSMTEQEAYDFETDLRNDEAMFNRLEPLLEISLGDVPFPEIAAEMDAMRAEAEAIRGGRAHRVVTLRRAVGFAAAASVLFVALRIANQPGVRPFTPRTIGVTPSPETTHARSQSAGVPAGVSRRPAGKVKVAAAQPRPDSSPAIDSLVLPSPSAMMPQRVIAATPEVRLTSPRLPVNAWPKAIADQDMSIKEKLQALGRKALGWITLGRKGKPTPGGLAR